MKLNAIKSALAFVESFTGRGTTEQPSPEYFDAEAGDYLKAAISIDGRGEILDLEALLAKAAIALRFYRERLAESGRDYPYGVAVEGEIRALGVLEDMTGKELRQIAKGVL